MLLKFDTRSVAILCMPDRFRPKQDRQCTYNV